MQVLRTAIGRALIACALLAASTSARAGIPVIDVSNLMQSIQQVLHMIESLENQLTQIQQYQRQIDSMTGSRGLGSLLRSPLVNNYVPLDADARLSSVSLNGYAGLTNAAKALRDVGMVYNCESQPEGRLRIACQASLARPYQNKALLQLAMDKATSRMNQIAGLIDAINGTDDPKSIAELDARLAGENALLAHETSRVQVLHQMIQTEREIEESRLRESTAAVLRRPRLQFDAPAF
jgi:type IV secretion system protein VirB5